MSSGLSPGRDELVPPARKPGAGAYLVLVVDPQAREVDAHGPLDRTAAGRKAAAMRADLDRSGDELADVQVLIVPLRDSGASA